MDVAHDSLAATLLVKHGGHYPKQWTHITYTTAYRDALRQAKLAVDMDTALRYTKAATAIRRMKDAA